MDAAFRRRKRRDAALWALTAACALLSVSVLLCVLGYLAYQGASSLSWAFLTRLPRPVGETGGGIGNAIVGSAQLLALAALLGVPAGVLGGVYLSEYGSGKAGFWIRYCADLLAGVPSIVMGLFAYTLIVLPMHHFSALSGAAALAVIMIPTVLRGTEEFLRLVPQPVREGALALGLPHWKTVLFVVLPSASRGILTAALLSLSRAAGETAPLLFTAFGSRYWDNGLLHPIASLPLTIYTYALSPYPDWHRQAWAAALILILLVLAINISARAAYRPARGG